MPPLPASPMPPPPLVAPLPHAAAPPLPASGLLFDVDVCDPRQQVEPSALLPGVLGLDSHYTSYLVRARLRQPAPAGPAAAALPEQQQQQAPLPLLFEVRRRFSDVVALAKVLPQLHPGSIFPARPEKDPIAARRASPVFVERRRRELETYLGRLCAHPVAGPSDALRVFLTTPGAVCLRTHPAWRAIKPRRPTRAEAAGRFVGALQSAVALGGAAAAPSPEDAALPASRSRDLYRQLHEGAAWLRGGLREFAPEDDLERALKQAGQREADQRSNLRDAHARGLALAGALAGKADALGALGAALGALERLEAASFGAAFLLEGGQRGPAASSNYNYPSNYTGNGNDDDDKARRLCSALASAAAGALSSRGPFERASRAARDAADPLRALASDTAAATAAFAQRERARLSVATLRRDLESRRAALAAAQSVPASAGGAQRRQRLGLELERAEAALAAAERTYGEVAQRNRADVDGYKQGRARALAGALLRVGEEQAAAWAEAEGAWRREVG
jgi:hypothetical protein